MVRSLAARRLPRSLAVLVTVLLAAFLTPAIAVQSADAAGQTIGGFEIDGNTTHETDMDWNDLSASDVFTDIDNLTVSGQDASTFQGSSHEYSGGGTWPGWKYGGGNAAGKTDFGRFAVYTKTADVGGEDHQFLYFAFDRGAGQGTDDYAFEFNQLQQNTALDPNPRRSQGDIRVILDDQGNGNITLDQDKGGLYVWDDPDQAAGGVALDADQDGDWVRLPSGNYFATSNAGTILDDLPSWWTSQNAPLGLIGPDRFIEAGLDLTDFGAALGCPSTGFTAANARSITGTGAGSLVDYLPFVPIVIPSTCSSIPIEKRVMNADGSAGALLGGATFTISPDPRPGEDGASLDVTDNDANDADPADGKILISPAKPGDYTIVEKTAPPGYVKDTDSEDVTAPKAAPAPLTTFLNGLGKVAWNKVDGSTGDPLAGATFRITATGGAAAAAPWNLDDNPISVTDDAGRDTDPADGAFLVTGLPTGTYELEETDAPTGYELDPATASFTISTTTVVTPSYATFTDPRVLSRLTVEKRDANTAALLAGAEFDLYRDDNGTAGLQQTGPDADSVAGSCVTAANGRCSVPDAALDPTLDWGYDYYWVETAPPAGYNLPNETVQGPISITAENAGTTFPVTVFNDTVSEIETTATDGALPGASISDSATLSGVPDNAQGTITFTAYGPVTGDNPQPTCTTVAFTSAPVAVSGPGTYGPVTYNPTAAGSYYWIASYSGDPAHQVVGVSGECGDANETSVVTPAEPGISTVATPTAKLPGAQISDTAKVNPVTSNAGGTVTFTLYGPGDEDCSGPATATFADRPITVLPDGLGGFYATASSPSYAASAGTYNWIAAYTGDANNEAVSGECGDENETSVVDKASPEIATVATPSAVLPIGGISDTATVTGLTDDATGTVTFDLYGPGADCSGPVIFTSTVTIEMDGSTGTAATATFLPTLAGEYHWIASYSGDANNDPVAGECLDANENSTVERSNPEIETLATTSVTLPDGVISDTATVTGLTANATGTVTFNLYGPGEDCSGDVVFTDTVSMVMNGSTGTAASATFQPSEAGQYHWIASYSGDANNNAVSGACLDANENTTVEKAEPAISTSATVDAVIDDGDTISDVATITGATSDATGTVTFNLYGPDDATCTGASAFTSTVAIVQDGAVFTATSTTFTPTETGTYRWIAAYSGDANNEAVSGECNDEGEASLVRQGDEPTLEKTADPANGSVVKKGTVITYTVTAGNVGDVPIEDGVVTDVLPANVTVDAASISDGGVYNAVDGTIVWTLDFGAAGSEEPPSEYALTYEVTVNEDTPAGSILLNEARFFDLRATTTHTTPKGALSIVKANDPTGTVVPGDTIGYSMTVTVSADANTNQEGVVVTDFVPGYDPALPDSAVTTYVDGSAKCTGTILPVVGTCVVALTKNAEGKVTKITWSLGEMAPGQTTTVGFDVTVNDLPDGVEEGTVRNVAVVQSETVPPTTSNEVVNPVQTVGVLPTKQPGVTEQPGGVLATTGLLFRLDHALALSAALLLLGGLVVLTTRRRTTRSEG